MGAPRGSLLAPPPPTVPSPAPLPPWSCFRRAPPAPVSPERQRPASPDEAPAPLCTGSFAPLRPGPQCVLSPSGGAGPACEAGVAGTGAGGLGCGVRAGGPERGQIGEPEPRRGVGLSVWDADGGGACGPRAAAALGVGGHEATRSAKGLDTWACRKSTLAPPLAPPQCGRCRTGRRARCHRCVQAQGAATPQTAHPEPGLRPGSGRGGSECPGNAAQERGCTVDSLSRDGPWKVTLEAGNKRGRGSPRWDRRRRAWQPGRGQERGPHCGAAGPTTARVPRRAAAGARGLGQEGAVCVA